MNFRPRTVIKGQALANFIAEFTNADTAELVGTTDNPEVAKVAEAQEENSALKKGGVVQWTLYVDDASNDNGSGAGIILISTEGHKIHYVLCFGFRVLNNNAEYEALIAGLHLAKKL